MFWAIIVLIWFILVMYNTLASAVLGLGIGMCLLGALLGWKAATCKGCAILFVLLAVIQIPFNACVFQTPLDRHVYDNLNIRGYGATERQDAEWCHHPHNASVEWLEDLGEIAPSKNIEKWYKTYLDKGNLTDTEEHFNTYFFGPASNPGDGGVIEMMIQEKEFDIYMRRGLVYRHTVYHNCTIDELKRTCHTANPTIWKELRGK